MLLLGVRNAFGNGGVVVGNRDDDLQPVCQPVVDRSEELLKGGSFSTLPSESAEP